MGHRSKRIAHGAVVLEKGPRAASPVARKNYVHRPSRTYRALELAMPASDSTAVFGSHELSVHVTSEERPLQHEFVIANKSYRGNVFMD